MIPESVFKLTKLEKLYPQKQALTTYLRLLLYSGINIVNDSVTDVPDISALKELKVL